MTTQPVYYVNPPSNCDLCNALFDKLLYDARLPRYRGSWANVCHSCFQDQHCRLGTGNGQKYRRQEDGRFLKVEG